MSELPNYCSGCGAPFTACAQTDPQCVTRMLTLNEADEIERLNTDCFDLSCEIERLRAAYEAAKVYVRDSYRPEPKYDAKRFDALVAALKGVESNE